MKLKIGRHEYDITTADLFMDNGACIQLITQSKEKSNYGRKPLPVLSKKAINQISKYPKIKKKHKYPDYVTIFSLDIQFLPTKEKEIVK